MRRLLNYFLLIVFAVSTVWNVAMAQQSDKTKTWCIGRFLVTLPANAELKTERDAYFFFSVDSARMKRTEFSDFLQRKEATLRSARHDSGNALLQKSLPFGVDSRVFTFWENKWVKELVNIEGHRFIGGRRFSISDKFSTDKEGLAISSTKELLQSLRYRDRFEIPVEPGFCIDYGFIPDAGDNNEKVNVSFAFKGQPDMHLSISTLIKEPGPTLLERSGGALSMLGSMASQVQNVRSAKRSLGPLAGEEWLVKVPTEGNNVGHQFTWETQGDDRSDYPFISIDLKTSLKGDSIDGRPSSLNDREALELWDSILNSFKLRPTSKPSPHSSADNPDPNAPASAAATPSTPLKQAKVPLGTRLSSGDACPQTGTWVCESTHGGTSRVFIEGEIFNGVRIAATPSLWQRLKGQEATEVVNTVWTLVSLPGEYS